MISEPKFREIPAGETLNKILEMIRSIVSPNVRDRISLVNRKGYSSIMIDNNNHRLLCRIYHNAVRPTIGLFNVHNVETKFRFSNPNDILFYATAIKTRAVKFI